MKQSEIIEELVDYGMNIIPIKLGSLINLLGKRGLQSFFAKYGAFHDINGGYIKSRIPKDDDSKISYFIFFVPLDTKKLYTHHPALSKDDLVGIVMISILEEDGLFSTQKDLLFLNTEYAKPQKTMENCKNIIKKEYEELC